MLGEIAGLSGAANVEAGIVISESVLYLLVLSLVVVLFVEREEEVKLEAEGGQKKKVSRAWGRPSVVVRILLEGGGGGAG